MFAVALTVTVSSHQTTVHRRSVTAAAVVADDAAVSGRIVAVDVAAVPNAGPCSTVELGVVEVLNEFVCVVWCPEKNPPTNNENDPSDPMWTKLTKSDQ